MSALSKAAARLATVAVLIVACQLDKLFNAPEVLSPPGPPARLVFGAVPDTARAGKPIKPAVRVTLQDSAGRPTEGDSAITLRLRDNPGNTRLEGDTAARPVNGIATFANLRLKKAAKGYALTARYAGIPLATSRAFTVAPDSAAALVFTVQPGVVVADSVITPPVEVTAFDGFDNQAANFSGAVRVALGKDGSARHDAKLAGRTLVPAASGVARFTDLAIDRAGTGYTLTAAFGAGSGGGSPAGESTRFDIEPRATRLEVITAPPAIVRRSSPFQIQVAALDNERRIVNAFTGRVRVVLANDASTGGNAQLGGATEASVVNGIATFSDLTIDQPGAGYHLRASVPGLASATSDAFNVL